MRVTQHLVGGHRTLRDVNEPLDIGDRIPDVALVDERSNSWSLQEHLGDGRPALLVFHRHLA